MKTPKSLGSQGKRPGCAKLRPDGTAEARAGETGDRDRRRGGRSPWRYVVVWGLLLGWTGGCGPAWYLDPVFAERLAKQEDKPLLFYFKAWDSTQHRDMRMKVFEHAPTKQALMDTVNVELEFAWFPDYAKRYRVRQPQVCVMCTPGGEAVSSALYVNPVPGERDFYDWLSKAKAEALRKTTAAQPDVGRAGATSRESAGQSSGAPSAPATGARQGDAGRHGSASKGPPPVP